MKKELVNQIIETQGSFGYTLNKFNIDEPFKIDKVRGVFDIQTRPLFVQKSYETSPNKSKYLKGLFFSDNLIVDDFKKIPSDCIYYYLDGFSDSEEEWGEDMPAFKALLASFYKKTQDSLSSCYLINKEWFSDENNKVRSREFALYDFYFIIIWIDKNDSQSMFISEWFSD